MTCSPIDDFAVHSVFAIVDHHSPDVDEGEKNDICELLKRENERKDMVGDTLSEAVKRMECMRRKGRWHDPLVVLLVQTLVD